MAFKKLLVPLDLSDKHRPALEAAINLIAGRKGTITLLHVIEVIAGLPREEEQPFYNRLEKSARRHLERVGATLKKQGVNWRSETLYGNRAVEIVRYAKKTGADLIVLTAPRMERDNPTAGWGSLSYKVSILSFCPVLLVK
jgi:universal stress protein A